MSENDPLRRLSEHNMDDLKNEIIFMEEQIEQLTAERDQAQRDLERALEANRVLTSSAAVMATSPGETLRELQRVREAREHEMQLNSASIRDLTAERDQARAVARQALIELSYQVGIFVNRICPLCGGEEQHKEDCAYSLEKAWWKSK